MIIHIVGARPNFMKCAVVYKALEKKGADQFIVHTGQHCDTKLSDNILKELELSVTINLDIAPVHWTEFVKESSYRIYRWLEQHRVPYDSKMLVYGDTSSTLGGALAATQYSRLPIYHVEAGLRAFNWSMPEERIRVTVDMLSDVLFAPTQTAVNNLQNEDLKGRVELVGDTTYDAFLQIKNKLEIKPKQDYAFCTLHRPQNVDNQKRLLAIIDSLSKIGRVIIPVHPRLKKTLSDFQLFMPSNIEQMEPLSYKETLEHIASASFVVTDSGGLQKEACWLNTRCVIVRDETEWVELIDSGMSVLCHPHEIEDRINYMKSDNYLQELDASPETIFEDKKAGERIAKLLTE